MSRHVQITFDCRDPRALSSFWRDVRVAPDLQGEARRAALETECERLVSLGAQLLRRHEPAPPMETGFIVMVDPRATSSVWIDRG